MCIERVTFLILFYYNKRKTFVKLCGISFIIKQSTEVKGWNKYQTPKA